MRILIIDDHTVARWGLHLLVERQPGWAVVGEAASGAAGLALASNLKPDVAVLDLSMPDGSGLLILNRLAALTHVLVLTMHDDRGSVLRTFSGGGLGYLLKGAPEAEFVTALSAVASGQTYVDQSLTHELDCAVEASSVVPLALSEREKAVLRLVALGYTNKEIGGQLKISVRTVETYKERIQQKLCLVSRADMVRYALQHGLVDAHAG